MLFLFNVILFPFLLCSVIYCICHLFLSYPFQFFFRFPSFFCKHMLCVFTQKKPWNLIAFCFCTNYRYEFGAVILHSPLMSGMRVAFPATRRTWFFDAFPSIDKVPKVTSPVLVIHGTEDEVIDFSHGLTIYEKCPRAVEPLWVEVIMVYMRI